MNFKIKQEELPNIIKLYYKDRNNLTDIAKLYNVGHSTIQRFLQRNNQILKTSGTHKNGLEFNKAYFENINTSHKAYFLGLLYADGAMFEGNYSVSLTLKDEDTHIIESFKNDIDYTGDIKHLVLENENHSNISYIQLYSKEFYLHCVDKNLIDKKSAILTFPNNQIVPDKYINDFIRGYFDGDGCVHYVKSRNCLRVNIVGTFEFLRELQNILIQNIGVSKTKIEKKSDNNNFALQIGKKSDVYNFYNFLYQQEDCLKLYRKWNIFKNYY